MSDSEVQPEPHSVLSPTTLKWWPSFVYPDAHLFLRFLLEVTVAFTCLEKKKQIRMLTSLTVVIISQYLQISNHYVAYLKLTQCYMSTIPQLNNNNKGINHRESWYCCYICCEQGRTKRTWFSKARTKGYIQCRQYKLEKLWGTMHFCFCPDYWKRLMNREWAPFLTILTAWETCSCSEWYSYLMSTWLSGRWALGGRIHTHYTRRTCAHTGNLGSQLAPTCHDCHLGLVFGCSAAICTCRANAERGKKYLS